MESHYKCNWQRSTTKLQQTNNDTTLNTTHFNRGLKGSFIRDILKYASSQANYNHKLKSSGRKFDPFSFYLYLFIFIGKILNITESMFMAFQHSCQPQWFRSTNKMKQNLQQKHWNLVQEAVGFCSPSQPSNGWKVCRENHLSCCWTCQHCQHQYFWFQLAVN